MRSDAHPKVDTDEAPAPPDRAQEPVVAGPRGQEIPAKGLLLAVEKFRRPRKHYRLIWVKYPQAWLCQEDQTPYRRSGEAQDAGRALAERYGVRLSPIVR